MKTYTGCPALIAKWGEYPMPSDPGTTPPRIWEDVMSTLATFDVASSSTRNYYCQKSYNIIINISSYMQHDIINSFMGKIITNKVYHNTPFTTLHICYYWIKWYDAKKMNYCMTISNLLNSHEKTFNLSCMYSKMQKWRLRHRVPKLRDSPGKNMCALCMQWCRCIHLLEFRLR